MNRHALVLLATAALLASCGKSATPLGPAGNNGLAYVRIVDGSPDIETVNPSLPPTAPACNFGTTVAGVGTLIAAQIDGIDASSSFPYLAVSSYVGLAPGTANVSIVPPGSLQTGCPSLTFTTPALAAGSYQTIVVSGAYLSKSLKFLIFKDPAPSSSPGAQIDNASQQSGTTPIGTFVPGTTAYQTTGSVSVGSSASVPTVSASPGLAYFAGMPSSPVTISPSQIDSFDLNNVLPFGNYGHLTMIIVDPPLGGTLPQMTGGLY